MNITTPNFVAQNVLPSTEIGSVARRFRPDQVIKTTGEAQLFPSLDKAIQSAEALSHGGRPAHAIMGGTGGYTVSQLMRGNISFSSKHVDFRPVPFHLGPALERGGFKITNDNILMVIDGALQIKNDTFRSGREWQ